MLDEIDRYDPGYGDDDLDLADTYVEGYYGLGGVNGDELFFGNDDDYLAFHDFKPNYYQRTYGMGRMIMGEFPCIYEALMMILHYEQNQIARPEVATDWIGFVMANFMLESSEFQDACYTGNVKICLEAFKQNRGMDVTIFNCYTAVEDAKQLSDEEASGLKRLYFLCYWGEHVFPIHREKCFELAKA